jgi:hypothetical protein
MAQLIRLSDAFKKPYKHSHDYHHENGPKHCKIIAYLDMKIISPITFIGARTGSRNPNRQGRVLPTIKRTNG